MQGFLKYAVCEEDEQVDILERIAGMIGDVLYKSRKFEAHLKHKKQIIEFYKFMLSHPENSIVEKAIFNLPCMHVLYNDHQGELDIDFLNIYLTNSQSENKTIKKIIASSLHEAFKLVDDDEDTNDLR
jgi:hypothetical protein